ncbi:carboxypeptidase-like regulatory domain-containing protein [Actinoplanes sp. GCM10030250]|uniref:carboxypeptidase-like regulatory domain-containing protein n=1 Tax=Actinoplanes sp. GCM10030250 TaxID=3273376 RepID=UPI00360C27A5
MQYTVSNPGPDGGEGEQGNNRASIRVTGMRCTGGDCSPVREIQQSENFSATLTAPDVNAGESRSVTITVTATLNNETATATETVTVKGPDAPQTVRQVSGRIKSSDGDRLSGVDVAMTDSAGHQYRTQTNGEGLYAFTSSDNQPIAPGNITVGAVKDGFQAKTVNVQGSAGRSATAQITLKKLASESPSASPSASVSASATPTEEEVTDEAEPTDEASEPAGGLDANNAASDAEGGTNWLLIIMGVLLVAAGIGAFALVWLRRRNSEAGGDDDAASTGFGGPSPMPVGGGQFDATRVASPVGAGRGGDATMIAPAGRMPGGISDAPTMIHRPVEDEFPDPYGAPAPAQGGFAGANDQWGDQDGYGAGQPPYGGVQQGGVPQQGGYGAQGAGYGNDQRYDEHTNLYQPEQPQQPQRYDEHTNLYQPEQGGAGYGGAPQGGYADQGGWGGQNDGYGPQGGYDQQGGAYGGYDQQQAGYGDQGGYGGAPQYGNGYGGQPPAQPGQPAAPGGYDQQQGGAYGGYDQQQQGGYGDQDEYYGPPNGQPGQRPNRNNWDD